MTLVHRLRPLLPLLVLTWLAGCALHQPPMKKTVGIGPYPSFSGRLIVIQPKQRWQVEIDWKASTPINGWLRLTHAASNRIIELSWHGDVLRLSDNEDPAHPNRIISKADLAAHGIVIPPQELAAILLDQMPPGFVSRGPDQWEATLGKDTIRVAWNNNARRLTLTNLTRGNRAILMIDTP